MPTYRHHITVYEHEKIRLGQEFVVFSKTTDTQDKATSIVFDESKLLALQQHYGVKGVPYYSLIHKGIQFNEHVGVIQVGELQIEVLPKADKQKSETEWRNMLIGMLRAVGAFDIRLTGMASLRIKPNTILDLYIEQYLSELEYLLHTGLVKKYRQAENNSTALKGSLVFGKHIQQNLTHQERFYVRHTTYDINHTLHSILYTALKFVKQINNNASLQSRIGALLLYFPEMPLLKVTETTFSTITYNRKTEGYRTAVDIARMLLLHYHPDVSRGRNHVLALMFDMNRLWEQFVFVSLRKHATDWGVSAQQSKDFWQPTKGYKTRIRPDIVLTHKTERRCIVLDTKWKNLNGYNPSPDDLRQMYVYHEYFGAEKTALVYPGAGDMLQGSYISKGITEVTKRCSVLPIDTDTVNTANWQKTITNKIVEWADTLPIQSISTNQAMNKKEKEDKSVQKNYYMINFQKVLYIAEELHKRGYENLHVEPSLSPSGASWRCTFVAGINREHVIASSWLWNQIDINQASDISITELTNQFEREHLRFLLHCKDTCKEYTQWYQHMLTKLAEDELPYAFADDFSPTDHWKTSAEQQIETLPGERMYYINY